LAVLLMNEAIFRGIGKPQKYALISIVGAIVGITASAMLIPRYGAVGAAIGFVGAVSIMMLVSLVILRQCLVLNVPILSWLKIGLAGIAFISVLALLKGLVNLPVLVEAILLVALASGVYAVLVLLLRVTSFGEIRKLLTRVW
ncbi:MAG TPA: polysaccharide biosynthesis C-terminal domain-containing protein, partial [Candidatus Binatia bacterium]|nr:polysaccharide biosynthesis C-terminal domain-containing protein [Candidatus Binatia bacterium]